MPGTHAHGPVTCLLGCMFSGKTTELLRRLQAFEPGARLVIKHDIDTRYATDAIVTHTGASHSAIPVASASRILDYWQPGITVGAIDEAHFFEDDIVEVARELARRGACVVIASLDFDSWGQPFPLTQSLQDLADESHLFRSVCQRCGQSAERTQRLTPIDGNRLVGGAESYEPRCLRCWRPPPETPPLL